jgi:protease-4
MKNFLQTVLASIVALIVFSIMGVVFIFVIAAAFSVEEPKQISANSVLVIDVAESFPEQSKSDAFTEFLSKKKGHVPSLSELIALIKHAKNDPSIKGIYLKCQQNPNGYAASEEIRAALLEFKKGDKFIIAFGETITQKGYWIGDVADQIYTHPQGGLEWSGFSYETMFLKGLLDKLEIQTQVFYAGKFKSATEPFRYTEMSPANKLQTSVWLNGVYNSFIQGAATQRAISTDSLKILSDKGMIQNASDALNYKLVDGLMYDDQVKKKIASKVFVSNEKDIPFVGISEYASSMSSVASGTGKIAVIFADGDIVMGRGQNDAIASDDYRAVLQRIRNDESIDAVVLRVNSPGGSALASDIIWREVELLKKEKPVVVSMGNYAASGGYYISCNADSIFADENTITGSIGVFSVVPNLSGFLKNKVGVTFDRVNTSTYADAPSTTRPLNATEQRFMQAGVDSIYFAFKSRVAKGRNKSVAYIDSIAQGRVWTGSDAVKVGLVDKIGTLNDAIASAAKLAKVNSYSLRTFPESKSFIEDFIEGYEDKVKTKAIQQEIGVDQWNVLKQFKSIKQMVGQPQTRMPIFVVNHP